MKICLRCQHTFEHDEWTCPHCHTSPTTSSGFYAFAPEMAIENDGLDSHAHHKLDELQSSSFWFRERNALIQETIERYFPDASNVLEIGCGSGFVLSAIRNALPLAKLTATEIYSYGLHYAAKRISQPCEFLQLDARRLPFRQEFDLVGAFDVLEHIDEDELVIQNIKQSLNTRGGVILTVPQHPWLWSKADEAACHKRRYTRTQLNELLTRNGFDIIHDTSFMFFLLPMMLVQRLISSKTSNYNPTKELTLPNLLDKTFESIIKFERALIRAGFNFPIGGSRLVVARLR